MHKITTMKGEETVNSEFNNLVSGGDSSKYDRLDRKTAMEAFLRYGLLSSLEDLGLLGSVHADLKKNKHIHHTQHNHFTKKNKQTTKLTL